MTSSMDWQNGAAGGTPLKATNLKKLMVIADAGTGGTPTGDALRAAFVPKWKPNTAYASGEAVLNPSGQTVTANAAFTSGTSYNAANWTVTSGGSGGTVTKASIGLGNVDNTSDVNKPVSSAQQTALNAKLDTSSAAAAYVAKVDAIDLEGTQDSIAGMFTGGSHSGISFAYDDPNAKINATVSGLAAEDVMDIVAAMIAAGSHAGITFTYNDAANSLSATVTGATGTPPSQVTGLTLGTATPTTQPLSWTAPSAGTSAITDYQVQYKPSSEPTVWTTFVHGASTTTSATVTGLTSSTSYDYRVAAVSAVGTGSYSATGTGSTASSTDITPPTAPSSLAAGTPTSTTIPLTWTASTDNVAVVGYNAYDSGTLLTSSLTGTSGILTGLTASTSYTITLKAFDAAGNLSSASNAVTVTTSAAATGVTFVAAGALADTASASPSVAYPAGIAAGDLLVMGYNNSATTTPTAPSVWTLLYSDAGTDYRYTAWYKIATGAESGSLTWATGVGGTAAMVAYRGVNQTTPFDTALSTVQTTTAATTIITPAATPATEGALPVWMGGGANTSRTFTSTGNSRVNGGTVQKAIFSFDGSAVSAGVSTGTRTVTASANNRMVALLALLRPAG